MHSGSRPHVFGAGEQIQKALAARHDPYQSRGKLSEPMACRDCGLVYRDGRWKKGDGAGHTHLTSCPACRRIHDKVPAGYLSIEGPFAYEHREDILRNVRNCEMRKRSRHPLQRIMQIDEQSDKVMVTTTDGRLAHEMANAIKHAFGGELDFQLQEGNFMLRARWYC